MIPRSFNIGIIWLLAQVNFGASFSLRQPFTTEVLADFPTSLQFWHGGESLFLGSGIKYKTIVFIHIQARSEALTAASGGSHWQCKLSRNIYEVALYIEEKGARREFLRLQKAGFFQQHDEETMCQALLEGNFNKLLQIRLLRSVTPSQLTSEIGRDLEPRLAKTGNQALWNKFEDYVRGKSLEKGVNFMALIHEDKSSDGGIFPPEFDDWKHASPTLSYSEAAFGEALLDMYVGSGKLVPEARQKWARAAQTFLPSLSNHSLLLS